MAGGPGVRTVLMVAVLLGTIMLAGCGKKGPPDPPGPPDQITYPRTYPTH
jgi:predicted small lipoprotein YifL